MAEPGVVQGKVKEAVDKLPPWATIVLLLALGGGGTEASEWIFADEEQVQEQVNLSTEPLRLSIDALTAAVADLSKNVADQAEQDRQQWCEIDALKAGTDPGDCYGRTPLQ